MSTFSKETLPDATLGGLFVEGTLVQREKRTGSKQQEDGTSRDWESHTLVVSDGLTATRVQCFNPSPEIRELALGENVRLKVSVRLDVQRGRVEFSAGE